MRPNREYRWSTKQPQAWQVTDLRWQLGFQWHRRGIELVFKSLDCFTKQLFPIATIFCCYICIYCLKLHQADYKVEEVFFFFFFFTSIWWGSTQLQCIYYLRRILISRAPRVIRRFKRRSCYQMPGINSIIGNSVAKRATWLLNFMLPSLKWKFTSSQLGVWSS